jgi:vesicle-fusing ATPase
MTATTVPETAVRGTAAERGRPALILELDRVKALLRAYGEDQPAPTRPAPGAGMLDHVAARLRLSQFERDVLLLAVAVELDAEAASMVVAATGTPRPTFSLAMAALPHPHWDALSPERPLRRWRLVEASGAGPVASRPLVVDEHVVHLVAGLVDETWSMGGLLDVTETPTPLTDTQHAIADELAAAAVALTGPVLVRLDGTDADARLAAARVVAAHLGRSLLLVRDAALGEVDLGVVATLLDREALIADRLVLTGNPRLLALLGAPVVATTAEAAEIGGRTLLARSVELPDGHEQVALWLDAMTPESRELEAAVREVAHHYRLPARSIAAIAGEWRSLPDAAPDQLRRLTRERARVGFGELADRLEPRAGWGDLVVPEGLQDLLRDLTRQVRHRSQVYDEWGFGARSGSRFGVTALFAGESGTGKTMAAEVIADDLGLDLYRIELSAVVSKYIGETEKNLRRVFDAGEAGGAVLLFDEADALFGKRSEVKDSHDRYANLEVAYLLQRMEAYRGLAILTTNLRSNVDRAFLRRLRFVVQFPFPDQHLRARIWSGAFPARTPTEGLDHEALARLQIPGGSIHAIAVSAAFAAADEGVPVRPEHVLHAAKVEYAKADRILTDAESRALAGRTS